MAQRTRTVRVRDPIWWTPALLTMVAVLVAVTFSPVLDFAFLNWDDTAVVTENARLTGPGVIPWAFTTTDLEHYQPGSWLVWSAVARTAGVKASAFHAANLIAHIACVALVFVLTVELMRRALPAASDRRRLLTAAAAALIYGVHPLRVEVVAWISALPYALALLLSLLALLAWLRTTSQASAAWWCAALVLFLASLAARPVALGLPLVLVILDARLFAQPASAIVRRVWPFVLMAAMAAMVESVARAPGVNDAPLAYRVQLALQAPLVYVAHTFAPFQLTPLDLLPASPVANSTLTLVSTLVLAAAIAIAWRWRRRSPWIAAAVIAYLALLAPAAGIISSGLQATADRYTYLPGVVLAVAVACAASTWAAARASRDWMAIAVSALAIAGSIAITRDTLVPWSDSLTLWSRVVALDPANDVALYNLGTTLAAAGRSDEAAARYRETLALVPQHASAKANLDRLEAARFERAGNDAAAAGNFSAAVESYRRAVSLDSRRLRAQAGLGMSLASTGRSREAIATLREAVKLGVEEAEISNTLAGLLLEAGEANDARTVLEAALRVHGDDLNLTHNLARLLATEPRFASTDASRALQLANIVVTATDGRDPRALDTLAAALAINGRTGEAATTSERAARLAAKQGDRELAAQITARGRAYRGR